MFRRLRIFFVKSKNPPEPPINMSAKTPKGAIRAENDIERHREDGNWTRVIELADLLIKSKPSLYNFIAGEAKLEFFLEQNPPVEKNFAKARIGLSEAKHHLLQSVTEDGIRCGVALDGHLLLAKVQYALGDYSGALQHYVEADLHNLTEKELTPRSIRIICESYAIKALCLEKIEPKPCETHDEWVDKIKHCYIVAGELAMLYLQQHEKHQQEKQHTLPNTGSHSPQPIVQSSPFSLSIIIETAILRAPIFLMENGKLPDAVNYYRNLLSVMEVAGSNDIRLSYCRQLAEVFMKGMTGTVYTPPPDGKKYAMTPWKPKKYQGLNMFVPRNVYEETILLLLISEAMAVKNAVLSQSPEFKDVRVRAFANASNIYDLITIALVRWRRFSILQECFERAMKFSSEESHIWMQQAMCLDSLGDHRRAFYMIKEVVRLTPTRTLPKLIAARIAYVGLCDVDQGLEWSKKALQCEMSNPQHLLSRCHLYIGIGAHCKAMTKHVKSCRDEYNILAMESFNRAHLIDSNDHLAKYYLGLQAACQCRIMDAVTHVKGALNLYPEHLASLHLMVLLLTAQKQMTEANELLSNALQDYSNSLTLHFLKIHIVLQTEGKESALSYGKRILSIWATNANHSSPEESECNKKNELPTYSSQFSDRDSNSMMLPPQTLTVSKVERAMSEVAASSTPSSSLPLPPTAQNAWSTQHKIWLLLAEIYLEEDDLESASNCLQEAHNIYPLSHHIMYLRGLVHEHKNEFAEAKQCFQNAISINPSHLKSLQHLGLMHHYLGNQRLAEKTLRFAVKLDPVSSQTWYNLGKVLESLGEADNATECLTTALCMETISPVLPYGSIPVTFE